MAKVPDEILSPSIMHYRGEIEDKQKFAIEQATEAAEMVQAASFLAISTREESLDVSEMLKDVQSKWRLIDEERQISVRPLNEEVKRINDWFRPALDGLKDVRAKLEKAIATFVLSQRREEERLRLEAQQAAQKVLAAAENPQQEVLKQTNALVTQAAQAAQAAEATAKGVSNKIVWVWKIVDLSKLPDEFWKRTPDTEKIDDYVKAHGAKDVPPGVSVEPDVKFRVGSG